MSHALTIHSEKAQGVRRRLWLTVYWATLAAALFFLIVDADVTPVGKIGFLMFPALLFVRWIATGKTRVLP